MVRKALSKAASIGDGAGEASDDVALGGHNRELRRREKLGTVWMLALLQEQGLINQTT